MLDKLKHHSRVSTRREFFARAGSGLAAMALADLLAEDAFAQRVDPLAAKKPHVTPKAKSVIFCFMEGGPSHVDLFDPKPELAKYAGQPVPPSMRPEKFITGFGTHRNGLMPSKHTFKQYGQSGLWFSDWLPHMAQLADDWAMVRSCQSDA